ncbi:phenylacetate--CoA ligase family protein [Streptomyces tubercidicus]|uniref:phenylacetate--CoA ligase family protein n=1 Tax=Streptomyces tubercidicus TaxID=47759 RepID=UPI0036C37814
MFTIFDDKTDAFARRTLHDHRRFDAGEWTPEELRAHQLEQLRTTLRYVTKNSPFYAHHLTGLDESSLEALSWESVTDLPFTTKDDLRTQLHAMLSQPLDRAWVFYETTGTTGRSTPCPRDNTDSIVNNTALTVCYDHVFRAHGSGHMVGVMGPNELHSTGDTFGDISRNLGYAHAKMWPHSPVVGFPRALEVLREIEVTAVFCAPNVALSLAKQAAAAGLDPRRDFGIRFFMLTGELATPGLLDMIGRAWGATAYNCLYASQEASILGAVHGDGRLRTVPLNVLYEVIDPVTTQPAPTDAHGRREGELVITHLYQGSKPLVRYRTGDLVALEPAAGAGYPSEYLLPLGRVRDVIDLNGNRVTAYDLEDSLLPRAEGVLDYQLVIDRTDDGTDTLAIQLHTAEGITLTDDRTEALKRLAQKRWGCPFTVSYGELGGITTTGAMVSWKAARVHDRRSSLDSERQIALGMAGGRSGR